MTVFAFTATLIDCPVCKKRKIFRDLVLTFDEVVHVGPGEELGCMECGYCLSRKESRPAKNGGILRGGWFFVCCSCFRDTFTAETVYVRDSLGLTTEEPPAIARCMWCEDEHHLTSPED